MQEADRLICNIKNVRGRIKGIIEGKTIVNDVFDIPVSLRQYQNIKGKCNVYAVIDNKETVIINGAHYNELLDKYNNYLLMKWVVDIIQKETPKLKYDFNIEKDKETVLDKLTDDPETTTDPVLVTFVEDNKPNVTITSVPTDITKSIENVLENVPEVEEILNNIPDDTASEYFKEKFDNSIDDISESNNDNNTRSHNKKNKKRR